MRLASTATGLFHVFSTVLQRSYIDVGFLGGTQVDAYGNINATCIGNYHHPKVRFPGSGGSRSMLTASRAQSGLMDPMAGCELGCAGAVPQR
jgi:glutaconate CoA-transferase subunit B